MAESNQVNVADPTASLLRPNQVEELKAEADRLNKMLVYPYTKDKTSVTKSLHRVNQTLHTQNPIEPKGQELDALARKEKVLREELLDGMPSQEEMRKNPPGAVGKHRIWEKRNKNKLLAWKNAVLRLNVGSDDPDIANFERFRPRINTLNMDNAQIPGAQYFLPSSHPDYAKNYDAIDFSKKEESPDRITKEDIQDLV